MEAFDRATGGPGDGWQRHARILDLGSGTGLVGERLAARGYTNVVGLDASSDMTAVAEAKRCYAELVLGDASDMRATAGFEDCSFDGLVSVGTFTPHHCGAKALAEAVRVVRSESGGRYCRYMRSTERRRATRRGAR